MTGADVLRQVRDALGRTDAVRTVTGYRSTLSDEAEQALAALDGCVVLTAEEAAKVRKLVQDLDAEDARRIWNVERVEAALALLTPKEKP